MDEKGSRRVSFLAEHDISVLDHDALHSYRVDPKYYFNDEAQSVHFQTIVRNMKLLHTFPAVEITSDTKPLSLGQVLKIWQFSEVSDQNAPSLTFFRSDIASHMEPDLNAFDCRQKRLQKTSVELVSRMKGGQKFCFKFCNVKGLFDPLCGTNSTEN